MRGPDRRAASVQSEVRGVTAGLVLPNVNGMDLHTAARTYAAVSRTKTFPILLSDSGKRPLVRWTHETSADAGDHAKWFKDTPKRWTKDGGVIGLAIAMRDLGPHGAIAVDLDHPHLMPPDILRKLEADGCRATTRPDTDRAHFYFLARERERWGNSPGKLAEWGCDVRGNASGLAVVSPTVRPDIGAYAWHGFIIRERPDWLAEMLTEATSVRSDAAGKAAALEWVAEHSALPLDDFGRFRIRMLLDTARECAEGGRHDRMKSVLGQCVQEIDSAYYPAEPALWALRDVWLDLMQYEDAARDVEKEFDRMLAWTIGQQIAKEEANDGEE